MIAMKSTRTPSLRPRIVVAAWLCLAPAGLLRAQDAAPADRNAVNAAVRPGGTRADSPVTFPRQGALPCQYAPDVRESSEPGAGVRCSRLLAPLGSEESAV
jgi:hypothetical protein